MKEKVYVVTAKSAEDAIRKIKGLKAKDGPVALPSDESLKDYVKQLQHRLEKVKFDELKTTPTEVFQDIVAIYRELETLLTTGNVDWDYKTAISEDHGSEDLFKKTCEMYDKYIKLHKEFCEKFDKELDDKVSDKGVKEQGKNVVAKYREKIDTAESNVMAWRDYYKDKLEKRLAKAKAPKKYNTVK